MAEHNEFGKLAEELAEQFLVEKNYKILAKNFRFQKAEVDIITEFEGKIVVISTTLFGFPNGHIFDNRPIIIGAKVKIEVEKKVKVEF